MKKKKKKKSLPLELILKAIDQGLAYKKTLEKKLLSLIDEAIKRIESAEKLKTPFKKLIK